MSIYELTQIIWRRRTIVAVVTVVLIAVGTGIVLLGGQHRTYTARAQVLLDQPTLVATADGSSVANKLGALIPTLCSVMRGDDAVARVARESAQPPETVRSDVRCAGRPGTTVAAISATTRSAERSRSLAGGASAEL